MGKEPAKGDLSLVSSIVCIVIMIVLIFVTRFLGHNPQYLPKRPIASVIKEKVKKVETVATDSEAAEQEKKEEWLYPGQSLDDVQALLGPPDGTMTITNRLILMYYGSMLDFIEGKLVTSNETLFAKIKIDRQKTLRKNTPEKKPSLLGR